MLDWILTELWNGNIRPGVRCGERHSEIMERNHLMAKNRAKLIELLGAEQTEILEKYETCAWEHENLFAQEAFSQGFCIGVRLMGEAMWNRD